MSDEQKSNRSFWNRLGSDRGLGVLILAGGAVGAYFCIIRPLLAGAHHEPSVSISMKGVMLSPFAMGVGVFYIVYGPRATRILAGNQKATRTECAIIAVAVVADSLLYFWLKNRLMADGYAF